MFQNQQIAVSFTNSVLLANLAADKESGTLPAFDYRLANIPGDPHPDGFTYVTGAMIMNTGDEARIAASICSDEELVTASKNGTPVRSSVVAKVSDELPYTFPRTFPGTRSLGTCCSPNSRQLSQAKRAPSRPWTIM